MASLDSISGVITGLMPMGLWIVTEVSLESSVVTVASAAAAADRVRSRGTSELAFSLSSSLCPGWVHILL